DGVRRGISWHPRRSSAQPDRYAFTMLHRDAARRIASSRCFRCFAGNLQRSRSRFRQKSWGVLGMASEITAKLPLLFRCSPLFLLSRGVAKAAPSGNSLEAVPDKIRIF